MPEQFYKVDEVFGVGRKLPLNYVRREEVDEKFIESLTRDHHVVIYGSSKQGKTCLRKNCLEDKQYIVVSCLNNWTLPELYLAILKEAGFSVTVSRSRTVSGLAKVNVAATGDVGLPLIAKGELKGEAHGERSISSSTSVSTLELDPGDVNDIIRALQEIKFQRFILLEDFHYLPAETQQNFAFALKAFHENSPFCFIVVGVWREQNRLITYNGDLTERVFSVDVDAWRPEALAAAISSGEPLLNVKFRGVFKDELIENCHGSIHIVQEACRRCCRAAKVFQTQENLVELGKSGEARKLIKAVVDENTPRYLAVLRGFAEGFKATHLEVHKWIIYAILNFENEHLERGIRLRDMSKAIKAVHPKGSGLNNGNIIQALKTVPTFSLPNISDQLFSITTPQTTAFMLLTKVS